MAKIGTAHVEVKPVVNEEALTALVDRIEEAVRQGVEAGIAAATPPVVVHQMVFNPGTQDVRSAADDEVIANTIRARAAHYRS